MKLARQLVDTLSGEWDPADYRDTYSEALRRVIEAKIKGTEPSPMELPAPARVTELMEALKRSLQERPRQHVASRKPTRARRHRAA